MKNPRFSLFEGDCLEFMRSIPDNTFDSCITDPPYHLTSIVKRFGAGNAAPAKFGTDGAFSRASRGFMGKTWDGGDIAFRVELWSEVMRVLKPGAFLCAFSGARTYHRMAVAIEDAGFEIRDQIMWVYGSGFPKSHNISKAIDRNLGAEREKVRVENPRNPKSIGGGHNVDGGDRPWMERARERGFHEVDSEVPATPEAAEWNGWGTALKPAHEPICLARKPTEGSVAENVMKWGTGGINVLDSGVDGGFESESDVRFPSNFIHDGSPKIVSSFPNDAGHSAARFFYCAKASQEDREEGLDICGGARANVHPTVKPCDLMRYLIRLTTRRGGHVFDPFMGSGSTGKAAMIEGMEFSGSDMTPEYVSIARDRISYFANPNRVKPIVCKETGTVQESFEF